MNKTERAIISECVALALDTDIETIVMCLDFKDVDANKIKLVAEEFISMIRHNKRV